MADQNLEAMVHAQMHDTLHRQLNSAVQVGDINVARAAVQQLNQLAVTQAKNNKQFTNHDIREVLKTKAPWFGVDPRRSARAVEFGKNMEPASFETAEAFADELIKAVKEEFDEPDNEPDDEPEEKEEKKVVRKRTDAPVDHARAVPRRSSGVWAKLSDAPKDIAEQIRNSADKFTRNATKEQREKYITTALSAAYTADQRGRARK